MESEVDTSILNSVNIKRFTKSVLEGYGAEINRSNSAKWEVTFPGELSRQLDRDHGTLVFDATDRELGSGDLLVQPGTTVFSALLNLVQQPGSVGRLRLTEDTLQVNPPTVLQESNLAVEVTDFSERTSDVALAFHFRVQFETPSSFHSEEMFSATVDPVTQTRLPELTKRLVSHLPQLLQQNNEHPPHDVSATQVQQAFEEAQKAVIDQSRPIISDLREDADESASERIQEITEWYDQRRSELDQQLTDQRQEIQKWKNKRRKARKDSTRRKYVKNRKEAEQELTQLQRKIEEKKEELDAEESTEIDEVIDRNEIDVDVSLIGVTEVAYVRGILELELGSNHANATIDLSYLPATDAFQGLDCGVCSRDLTEGVLPKLCANGHLIGNPCATSCRSCGLTYCEDCYGAEQWMSCVVCWEDICQECYQTCASCGTAVCTDHSEFCDICESITCHLCGEECTTCSTFHCDSHLMHCSDCDNHHCDAHTRRCSVCESPRCETDIEQCSACDDLICSDHSVVCTTCGETLCHEHTEVCATCAERQDGEEKIFCRTHAIQCSVGEEIVCSTHRVSRTLGTGHLCQNHHDTCDTCDIVYSTPVLNDGQCTACRSLGDVAQTQVPTEITSDFRSVEAGSNDAYMVVLGKRLLGRNKIIIYDMEAEQEVDRHSAGMLKQLMGAYK